MLGYTVFVITRPKVVNCHLKINFFKKSIKIIREKKHGLKFWKKCHVTLWLTPFLPIVSFGDTVPPPP